MHSPTLARPVPFVAKTSPCNRTPNSPGSLWFTPRLEAADESGAPLERSAAERAQQLADVALAVYEAGGETALVASCFLLHARAKACMWQCF